MFWRIFQMTTTKETRQHSLELDGISKLSPSSQRLFFGGRDVGKGGEEGALLDGRCEEVRPHLLCQLRRHLVHQLGVVLRGGRRVEGFEEGAHLKVR